MRFGLFCSPKADSGELGPETGLIFYKIFADEVVMLRVVHGARKEPWENL
jgi:hypothetical protein